MKQFQRISNWTLYQNSQEGLSMMFHLLEEVKTRDDIEPVKKRRLVRKIEVMLNQLSSMVSQKWLFTLSDFIPEDINRISPRRRDLQSECVVWFIQYTSSRVSVGQSIVPYGYSLLEGCAFFKEPVSAFMVRKVVGNRCTLYHTSVSIRDIRRNLRNQCSTLFSIGRHGVLRTILAQE